MTVCERVQYTQSWIGWIKNVLGFVSLTLKKRAKIIFSKFFPQKSWADRARRAEHCESVLLRCFGVLCSYAEIRASKILATAPAPPNPGATPDTYQRTSNANKTRVRTIRKIRKKFDSGKAGKNSTQKKQEILRKFYWDVWLWLIFGLKVQQKFRHLAYWSVFSFRIRVF